MREEARVSLIFVACILRFTVLDRDGSYVLLAATGWSRRSDGSAISRSFAGVTAALKW
jgi:hypothetical protein